MKKLINIVVAFLISTTVSRSQVVTVLDKQTANPVPDVFIFNKDKTVTSVTNEFGEFDISPYKKGDTLFFQHSSYNLLKLPEEKIIENNYTVYLDEKLFNLNEVVVSAKRWEENTTELPNEITVIDKKEIILQNPATSADMIQQSGQVFVQKSQLGGGSPMIRGFAANRILFVLDGVRMNNAIYRSGNLQNVLQADVNSIESTEIIFGPGTNIYGSDALGGVIDIHLKKPVFNIDSSWKTSGKVYAGLASAAWQKTGHFRLNTANDKLAFLTMVSFSDFDDLRMGSHGNDFYLRKEYVKTLNGNDTVVTNDNPLIQHFSGYSQTNVTQKTGYKINDYSRLNLNFYYSVTSGVPRYDRLLQKKRNKFKYAEWYYKPQSWMMLTAGYTERKKRWFSDNIKTVFAYQNVKEGRNDRKLKKNWLRKRKETVNILSSNVDIDKDLKRKQNLYYGLELVYNNVKSEAVKENIKTGDKKATATRYPDGGTNTLNGGVYVSYKKSGENVPLTFQAGTRLSYFYLDAKFVDTSWYHLPYTEILMNNTALTGSAGISYYPGNWKLSLNLSSGYRAPNLDDVAKIFDSEPGNVVVPNENLSPEYLYNSEISVSKSFRNRFMIKATAFYSYLDNAMVRGYFLLNGKDSIMYDGEMSKVEAVVNTGYAKIYGVNGTVYAQITGNLGFETYLNYIKGHDNNFNPLRHVSPFFGKTEIIYEHNKLQLAVNCYFNGEVSYDDLAPSERKKTHIYAKDENGNPYAPAWWTLNFNGSYAFNKNFLLTFGVENILDKRYRPYSSGITAPGINFITALHVSF